MYDLEIRRVGQRYQVDPPLIKAVIQAESDFDSRAVSSRGAQGLMQLMPETARELRVDNPFNPRENIDGGTRYLRQMLDNFKGDLTLSLAAYNAGPGLVSRTGGVPQIPETVQYVNKVLKQYKEYKRQPGNGIYLVRE
jgi:soluble lytic murein transglycosylase-like protein